MPHWPAKVFQREQIACIGLVYYCFSVTGKMMSRSSLAAKEGQERVIAAICIEALRRNNCLAVVASFQLKQSLGLGRRSPFYCPPARRSSSSAPTIRLRVAATLLLPKR